MAAISRKMPQSVHATFLASPAPMETPHGLPTDLISHNTSGALLLLASALCAQESRYAIRLTPSPLPQLKEHCADTVHAIF